MNHISLIRDMTLKVEEVKVKVKVKVEVDPFMSPPNQLISFLSVPAPSTFFPLRN